MRKRIARLFDSIVYAGLEPDQKAGGPNKPSRLAFLNRYLDGGKPVDPLYLSNQTFWQKSRRPILLLLPFVLIVGIVALSSLRLINKKTTWQAEPSAAERAARSLNFKDLKIDTKKEIEILEVALGTSGGAQSVTGRLQNLTDRHFSLVDITFEITDTQGSQLGAHHVYLRDLAPRAAVSFDSPIRHTGAALAIVTATRVQ